jgi:hypothetical protein
MSQLSRNTLRLMARRKTIASFRGCRLVLSRLISHVRSLVLEMRVLPHLTCSSNDAQHLVLFVAHRIEYAVTLLGDKPHAVDLANNPI